MALKSITIPITDHDDECVNYYLVEWKLSSESGYSSMFWYDDRIIINNVLDASTYNVRVTRYCCNGNTSTVLTLNVDTTTDSTQLATPANFVLAADSPPVSEQLTASWDIVANADTYHGILSQDPTFTVITNMFSTTDPTISISISGLSTGITYYGKVLARASGYADSAYSNSDSAVTP